MRGRWIKDCRSGVATYTCSVCNKPAIENSYYCPFCGADLRCVYWNECKDRTCWNASCYEGIQKIGGDTE